MKQIFHYHGYPISEEMLFGIGCGLSFIYVGLSRSPIISGRTKTEYTDERVAASLHVPIKCSSTKEYGTAFLKVKRSIDNDQPVMVYVDMPYLSYLNLNEGSHFGGHAVVIFGYDDEKECFYVSDRDNWDYPINTPKGPISEDFHLVSYQEMEQARSSKYQPFPANNKYLEFDFRNPNRINDRSIYEAINETCRNMLEAPAQLMGINGIRKFSKEVIKWKQFDELKLKISGISNYFMIHKDGGTGGGMFRRMYGDFLVEAGGMLRNSKLELCGQEYISISERWDDIAQLLKELGKSADASILNVISAEVSEVAKAEETVLQALYTGL